MPDHYIEGFNRITVDIIDRNLARVGPGPLTTCLSLSCTSVLSQAGSFTARFPANDPRLVYLQLKRHFLWFYVDGVQIFRGLAERWSVEIDNSGQMILVVEGRDELGELDETTIDFFEFAPGLPISAVQQTIVEYNSLNLLNESVWWTVSDTDAATGLYGRFAGESALKALRQIAERVNESFRLGDTPRQVVWLPEAPADSGVRAVQSTGDPVEAENNPTVCFIQNLSERRDASRMITKIYPFGSGFGDTRLDLRGTTRTAPSGFTYNDTWNWISNDAAETYVGKAIARHVNFKEIRPLYNTDADMVEAKNYLFDAALAYLRRNDDINDVVEYELEVVALPSYVRVGQSIRVVYRDERYDLDENLYLLGVRRDVNEHGEIRYYLTVATVNQWRLRETSDIVSQMEEGEILLAHPQIDGNSWWENFREEVGPNRTNHVAQFPFFLGAEIVTVRQVLFRYRVDRIVSATKSYALESDATGQNAAASTISISTTETENTNTTATQDSNTTATQGTNTANTGQNNSAPSGSTDANLSGPGGATFTAMLSDSLHSGESDENDTGTNITISGPMVGGVSDDQTSEPPVLGGVVPHTGFPDPDTWTMDHTAHRHPVGSHVHTFDHNHTAELPQHTHGIDHQHAIPTHQHRIEHVHDMPHTHNMPHTHDMPHTHNMPHTHGLPQHTHPLPDLTESFAVERVPFASSYVMSDLEYSVNGGEWAALDSGTPVAGDFYEVDITPEVQSPGGLRRPLQEYNVIEVRRTEAAGGGKSAMIRAKICVRCTIQSIVAYA